VFTKSRSIYLNLRYIWRNIERERERDRFLIIFLKTQNHVLFNQKYLNLQSADSFLFLIFGFLGTAINLLFILGFLKNPKLKEMPGDIFLMSCLLSLCLSAIW
jgi:hypothetical protein